MAYADRDPAEVYTLSAGGITLARPGAAAELITLERWLAEAAAFAQLRARPAFRGFRAWKRFHIWWRTVRLEKIAAARVALEGSLVVQVCKLGRLPDPSIGCMLPMAYCLVCNGCWGQNGAGTRLQLHGEHSSDNLRAYHHVYTWLDAHRRTVTCTRCTSCAGRWAACACTAWTPRRRRGCPLSPQTSPRRCARRAQPWRASARRLRTPWWPAARRRCRRCRTGWTSLRSARSGGRSFVSDTEQCQME